MLQMLVLLLYGYITTATTTTIAPAFTCPDGSHCDDQSTCCQISAKVYGCCPLPKAVCCKDLTHCCPHNYLCDLSSSTCFRTDANGLVSFTKIYTKKPSLKSFNRMETSIVNNLVASNDIEQNVVAFNDYASSRNSIEGLRSGQGNVMCPDKCSVCPTGTTCCLLECGRYGCCRYENGVCCSDHIHCCPHNYKCAIPYCQPQQQYIELPMKKVFHNDVTTPSVLFRKCPDGKTKCKHGEGCCPALSDGGGFNCCGYHKGECCSDGSHCCPRGFKCDLDRKLCLKEVANITAPVKFRAEKVLQFAQRSSDCDTSAIKREVLNDENGHEKIDLIGEQICKDKKTKCPDNNTCCDGAKGGSYCCKFPKAVCCEKSSHCCPNGYVCAPGAALCNKSPPQLPKPEIVALNTKCPDGVSQCPDNNTCCSVKKGGYGCCPIPKAVCCADKKHCCPSGYSCDVEKGSCQPKKKEMKIKGNSIESLAHDLSKFMCPDNESRCYEGETCCQLHDHQYGCCPLPNAVCCPDEEHCCPHGYNCRGGFCSRGDEFFIAFKTRKHKKKHRKPVNIICPDGLSECPEDNTCCKLESGKYGCCPLPSAVCCADKKHCCPKDFTCSGKGRCTKGGKTISALEKHIASVRIHKVTAVEKWHLRNFRKHTLKTLNSRDLFLLKVLNKEAKYCSDGFTRCKQYEVCCPKTTGGFKCCPFQQGLECHQIC